MAAGAWLYPSEGQCSDNSSRRLALGLYSHSTHIFIPDKDHGRLLAGAMLKSPHSLVMSTPYGSWINVYLPMGLSYKDVPELPTSPYIELNCYNSEGFDLRLYKADRLAFLFESGCGDVSEEEDTLLEAAANLWRSDPNRPTEMAITPAAETDEEKEAALASKEDPDFWDLPQNVQDDYIARAKQSPEYRRFVQNATESDEELPEVDVFFSYLPEDRGLTDFQRLLAGASRRLFGPPTDEGERQALEKWMKGKHHSDKAEDYVQAIAVFLGLKGALWGLETLQQQKGDKIDRRIVKLEELDDSPNS